ncbi:MAG TPA: DNA translocase FtsK 4TM domain-containing protein [Bryobacteraceae bacterium]|nr:DNA translocase FtsK 4TM domain-containing protein [Bryobacteraceae bacterium]
MAPTFPIWLVLAWNWVRGRRVEYPLGRAIGYMLFVLSGCAGFALGPEWKLFGGAVPAGGTMGVVLAGYLVAALNVTGAGIVAPMVNLVPGVNKELLVLATGAGSLILSHVNDAGFWLVKQYFNMTVVETFKTWTVMETLISVVAIVFIMILAAFV